MPKVECFWPLTTKTMKQVGVVFYATSSRLAHAYRIAAKHNRSLTCCAKIQELEHGDTLHGTFKEIQDLEMVVLSHADDAHLVLTDARVAPIVADAFHL